MVVSFALLDVEPDLDFRPEALNAPRFVPGANVEFDAPRDTLAISEFTHCEFERRFRALPLLHAAICICDGFEAYGVFRCGGAW